MKETWSDRLNRAVAIARTTPDLCDVPHFWDAISSHDFRETFAMLTGWAQEGFEDLFPGKGWEFLLLATGDSPDIFHLCPSGIQEPTTEEGFRKLVLRKGTVSSHEFAQCCKPKWLWGEHHSVVELFDDLLSFPQSSLNAKHSNSGLFLWLVLCGLALIESISDVNSCRKILQGRDRLYLLPGFGGETFFYAATVTQEGLKFEIA